MLPWVNWAVSGSKMRIWESKHGDPRVIFPSRQPLFSRGEVEGDRVPRQTKNMAGNWDSQGKKVKEAHFLILVGKRETWGVMDSKSSSVWRTLTHSQWEGMSGESEGKWQHAGWSGAGGGAGTGVALRSVSWRRGGGGLVHTRAGARGGWVWKLGSSYLLGSKLRGQPWISSGDPFQG